jgi:hypothetical protein
VRLKADPRMYVPDPDFDIERFREQLEKPKGEQRSYDPTDLREWLQKGREYSRQQIAQIVMDETGRGKSWTYDFIKKATKQVLHYTWQTKIYKLR